MEKRDTILVEDVKYVAERLLSDNKIESDKLKEILGGYCREVEEYENAAKQFQVNLKKYESISEKVNENPEYKRDLEERGIDLQEIKNDIAISNAQLTQFSNRLDMNLKLLVMNSKANYEFFLNNGFFDIMNEILKEKYKVEDDKINHDLYIIKNIKLEGEELLIPQVIYELDFITHIYVLRTPRKPLALARG